MDQHSRQDLQRIPGIGPLMAEDLMDLGFRQMADLDGQDPEVMYQRLMDIRGHHVDRCVLYVFRCAVYFASHQRHDPDLLKWWNWKDTA